MKNILRVFAVMVTMLLSLVYITTQTIAPDYGFDLSSNALAADVEIVFDDMAVPHIYAESEHDALHALGYVHAMERLWQMDLLRRAGGGELSALLGPDMIDNDKYLRTLGMRKTADRTVEQLKGDRENAHIVDAMQAYLDGVNAYIASGELPFEYRLINAKPQPFDLHDVYCATGFMAYSFAIHLKTEPILDWMVNHLDSARIADVYWNEDGYQRIPTQARDISGLASKVHELDALRPVPQWLGSNAWVLSGDRTASGKVLFCNDAHMAYASPSVWYEAHVVTPELEYYGNHIGGLPFPVIGHTRDHAWGVTMFVNDEIDLFRETIEGDTYYHNGEWLPLDIRTETLEVAGKAPVTFEVRETHHGPLLEDDVAMWWTFNQYPENKIHQAFYGFSRESGVERFAEHASLIHAPGLNMMYGDAQGDIGWWACAKLPIYRPGIDTKVAIDGTDPANDPQGWHGFDANPRSVNPASGYVYSANNAPQTSDSVNIPGHYYAGNTRASAIMKALSAPKNDWDVAQAQALQLDHHSPVYEANAAMLVAYADEAGVEVEPFLREWEGSHLAEEVAPTLYYRWMYRTIQAAMYDEFLQAAGPEDAQTSLSRGTKPSSARTPSPNSWPTPNRFGGTTWPRLRLKRPPTSWHRP